MKENYTVFDYFIQVMVVFGFSILILNIFCIVFGDSAQEFSSIFALGSTGISVDTTFQYLGSSAFIVAARFVFFTDIIIKHWSIGLRTIGMLGVTISIMALFIAVFGWFPVNMVTPWIMFFICFGISFLGSYFITKLKENAENKKLNDALDRLKEKEAASK